MKPTERPKFLEDIVSEKEYERWLHRKSVAHVTKDMKSGNKSASGPNYKKAIHEAVRISKGKDFYTGEILEWHLLSKWSNDDAAAGKREYKTKFALLPTVNHIENRTGEPFFSICAWRTNDAKGDMSTKEFISLCKKVVKHMN